VLVPGLGPQETGYWNPSIVTGEDGKATVTFAVPERSTAWTLLAKGITAETLAGEATDELVVKKDLFGELKLPLAFTDGDEADVLVSVHNDAVEAGQIEVTLKTTIDGRSVEEKKTVDVQSKGVHELAFKCVLHRPDEPNEAEPAEPAAAAPETSVVFELAVAAGDKRDTVRRAVPLKPFGVPVFATASGSATSDTTAWVEPPKDMPLRVPVSDNHIQNWFDAIKSRGRPIADVEIGHRSAILCHLGNIARWVGRKLRWDPEREIFPDDEEANAYLERPMRTPYGLPELG